MGLFSHLIPEIVKGRELGVPLACYPREELVENVEEILLFQGVSPLGGKCLPLCLNGS
jgi:hypothetical protein